MLANKVKNTLGIYSLRIHNIVRTIIKEHETVPIGYILNGLEMNPLPFEYEHSMFPSAFETRDSITHIPLYEDSEFGIESKAIIWNPMVESNTHSHPGVHCFFSPVQLGLCHTINDTTEVGLIPRKYNYIHDSVGSHRMRNSLRAYPIVSYHLYIQESVITKKKSSDTHIATTLPKGSRSIHTEAYNHSESDLVWYGTRS
jgi:hypothetical protein